MAKPKKTLVAALVDRETLAELRVIEESIPEAGSRRRSVAIRRAIRGEAARLRGAA